MKNKLLVLVGVLIMSATVITACTQGGSSNTSGTQQSGGAQAGDSQSDDSSDGEQATDVQTGDGADVSMPLEITAAEISEEDVAALDGAAAIMLGITDDEYISHVLIQVNVPVTDMKLWALRSDFSEDGKALIYNESVIAKAENVTADNKVVVSVKQSETLPWNGISFVDASGEEHFMFLSWSGEDGHPFLTDYVPAE